LWPDDVPPPSLAEEEEEEEGRSPFKEADEGTGAELASPIELSTKILLALM
jgi:hypothetical protein